MENNKIKFYKQWSKQNHAFYLSGKNEKGKYFSLWKSKEFNNDLYLNNNLFTKGLEIEKSKLKLLENNTDCKVLVFKNANDEREICITKEDIEKQKEERKKINFDVSDAIFVLLGDCFKELLEQLRIPIDDFKVPSLIKKCIELSNDNELSKDFIGGPDDEEELPF